MKCGNVRISVDDNVCVKIDIIPETSMTYLIDGMAMEEHGHFVDYLTVNLDAHEVTINSKNMDGELNISLHPEFVSLPINSNRVKVIKKYTESCPPDYCIEEVHTNDEDEPDFMTYVNGPMMDED